MLESADKGVAMRRMAVWAALLAMGVAACGDDAVGPTSEPPGVTFDASACPDPIEVADAEALIAVLAAQPWDWVGPYTSGSEPPSADLIIVGEITITGEEVPLPARCLQREDCRHAANFSASQPGAAVTGSASWFEGMSQLTLSDTTVRVSTAMMDTHPGPFNYVPVVSVIGPCGAPCGEGSFACQADLSCYGDYEVFCRRCENRPAEECACRDAGGPRTDGTFCEYFVSGDVIEVGTCRSGRCETGG